MDNVRKETVWEAAKRARNDLLALFSLQRLGEVAAVSKLFTAEWLKNIIALKDKASFKPKLNNEAAAFERQ